MAKIREKVGNDFIVGIKLNCEEGDKNGITEEAFFKICLMLEANGIDFIDISGMSWMKERTKNLYYADVGIK